jgi:hypothetical protein
LRTNARTKVLKELVRESQYVVDPAAVAEAIIARSVARQVLPDVAFRSTPSVPQARSFRRHRGGRSFRLSRPERRAPHRAGDEPNSWHVR